MKNKPTTQKDAKRQLATVEELLKKYSPDTKLSDVKADLLTKATPVAALVVEKFSIIDGVAQLTVSTNKATTRTYTLTDADGKTLKKLTVTVGKRSPKTVAFPDFYGTIVLKDAKGKVEITRADSTAKHALVLEDQYHLDGAFRAVIKNSATAGDMRSELPVIVRVNGELVKVTTSSVKLAAGKFVNIEIPGIAGGEVVMVAIGEEQPIIFTAKSKPAKPTYTFGQAVWNEDKVVVPVCSPQTHTVTVAIELSNAMLPLEDIDFVADVFTQVVMEHVQEGSVVGVHFNNEEVYSFTVQAKASATLVPAPTETPVGGNN